MGIWVEILRAAAKGDDIISRALLFRDLILKLREPVFGTTESEYRGPLPHAVQAFISRLPRNDRILAETWREDFIDYIIEDVVFGIERTLTLVETCVKGSYKSLYEIVQDLPWPKRLKRDHEWKRQRIADELRSMIAVGIPLPNYVLEILGNDGKAVFEFNEIAYAIAPKRLELSWGDFKHDQEIDDRFVCITDSEEDTGVGAESVDYGSLPIARIVVQTDFQGDFETLADLHSIGGSLSPEIATKMESMHAAQPRHGYHPIAWHNVFWEVVSEYEILVLSLEQRSPFCETDQVLADYIVVNHLDVIATSRPSITRRRIKLYDACNELVQTRIFRYLNKA